MFNDTLIREFSVRIVADTVIEGKKYFRQHIYANSLISSLVINLPSGYYGRIGNKDYLAIPYPVTLGNKYKSAVFDSNDQLVRFDDIEVTVLNLSTRQNVCK